MNPAHINGSQRRPITLERLQAPIRELVTRDVVAVSSDTGVDSLEQLLLERGLSGVPVIDPDRRLVGYVAMTDIVRDLHDRGDTEEVIPARKLRWGFHAEPVPRTVADVMSPIAYELQETCPVSIAIELMRSRHVHRLPVVSDDGALIGIVSAGDIVRFLATREPQGLAVATERTAGAEAERVTSLGFLAGGLAHQVNNALTPMRLSLGRLTSFELSRRPMSEERLHRIELLQDMREGLDRVARIVHELNVFAHTEDAPPAPVDVVDELELALGLAAHEIRHRGRLVREYSPVPRVCAQPVALRQILLNLVINAVHATPEGEAHIHDIYVRTSTDARQFAVVEIEDTGTGIPVDALPRIFEPFFTTHPGRALGLGLAVTRDLVTALGGQISVDSVVGRGTRVRIALPPCESIARGSSASLEPPQTHPNAPRLRILIVDDDRPVAAAIALELDDHDVVVAESGREALEILHRDKSFDVILCDLMMPEVSGMDVYEAVRLVNPALLARIVLMTGGAFTPRARDFLASIETPLLEKPFEASELRALVSTLASAAPKGGLRAEERSR
jgi:signal transduction histidine kinase/CheY-like chemotaxis protein